MTAEEILKKYPSAKVIGTIDNSEWADVIKKQQAFENANSHNLDIELKESDFKK